MEFCKVAPRFRCHFFLCFYVSFISLIYLSKQWCDAGRMDDIVNVVVRKLKSLTKLQKEMVLFVTGISPCDFYGSISRIGKHLWIITKVDLRDLKYAPHCFRNVETSVASRSSSSVVIYFTQVFLIFCNLMCSFLWDCEFYRTDLPGVSAGTARSVDMLQQSFFILFCYNQASYIVLSTYSAVLVAKHLKNLWKY